MVCTNMWIIDINSLLRLYTHFLNIILPLSYVIQGAVTSGIKLPGAKEEPLLLHSTVCGSSSTNFTEYDPNLITNFDCLARKTVMKFNGYVVSFFSLPR